MEILEAADDLSGVKPHMGDWHLRERVKHTHEVALPLQLQVHVDDTLVLGHRVEPQYEGVAHVSHQLDLVEQVRILFVLKQHVLRLNFNSLQLILCASFGLKCRALAL